MYLRLTIFIFHFILLFGCTNQNPCSLSEETLKALKEQDSIISLPEIQIRDYNWMKDNYDEPSILNTEYETYRLILSGAWGRTKIVRIENHITRYNAIIKEFGRNGAEADSLMSAEEFEISKHQWEHIVKELQIKNFWNYFPSQRYVLDGACWFLEGFKHKKDPCTFQKYHGVGTVSSFDTTFVQMCNLLKNLKR